MNPNDRVYAVKAKGLRKEFGRTAALERLDPEVRRGELFGLVGPDGAGKSTTLRMLATVMLPTSGSGRGVGLVVLWPRALALAGFGTLTLALSIIRFGRTQ